MNKWSCLIMSEDIHKWTTGKYTLMFDEHTFFVWDNEKEERMTALETTKKLNEQQAIIEQLKSELNNYEKISNLLPDDDAYHYDRWIKQIKKYVEKTNEDFEYNEEFIIKLCLSYTLQSLRNNEDLKRFQWGMVNDE